MVGKLGVEQANQCLPHLQPWMSDTEESPFLDPALRKRAVKVKHVKRREKKSDKKVMEAMELGWGGRPRTRKRGGWGCRGRQDLGLTSALP